MFSDQVKDIDNQVIIGFDNVKVAGDEVNLAIEGAFSMLSTH